MLDTNSTIVEIIEVSPRDGLQNEPTMLPTASKVELVERAVAAGASRVEVSSFVSPKHVPQLADAEAVFATIGRADDLRLSGLILNERGFQRALAVDVAEINFVIVASDTFNRKNQGVSTEESIQAWSRLASQAAEHGVFTTVTIAAAFGCPFEGEVPLDRLARVIEATLESPPDELALADTIGVATPSDVRQRIEVARRISPRIPLRCHFHNTRNSGLANAVAAVEAGVLRLDSSIGGIGGCPFAPAATGNIPTEDLVYILERMGYSTGLDLDQLCSSAIWLGEQLESVVPGMLSRSGPFPPLL